MFLSCSHFNVSLFALKVRATTRLFALEYELRIAMFLSPRDYVFAPLHLFSEDGMKFALSEWTLKLS
jgi:hypothetical protein